VDVYSEGDLMIWNTGVFYPFVMVALFDAALQSSAPGLYKEGILERRLDLDIISGTQSAGI
jgi:hypothetical protein